MHSLAAMRTHEWIEASHPHAETLRLLHECRMACATTVWCGSGHRELQGCVRRSLDCVSLCDATIDLMIRGSPIAGDIARLCFEALEDCADECANHVDEHCRAAQAMIVNALETWSRTGSSFERPLHS